MLHAHEYAEALFLAGEAAPGEAEWHERVERLIALLASRGHHRLLPRIVAECEALVQRRYAQGTTVRVAHADDATRYEAAIAADAARLGEDVRLRAPLLEVDDRVVGGYEVRTSSARIDRTYRRALTKLYTHLISSSS